jgi:hypothetical protein
VALIFGSFALPALLIPGKRADEARQSAPVNQLTGLLLFADVALRSL